MKPQALRAELWAAWEGGDAERRIALYKELAISGRAVINVGTAMAIQRIRPLSGAERLYEPDSTGQQAIIVPCLEGGRSIDTGAVLTDLVAVDIDEPERWWLRVGAAVMLGSYWAEKAEWLDEPLQLYSNPLGWLRAECAGACVLDWQCAAWRLAGVHTVIAESLALARKLEQALHRPSDAPEIRVRKAA